VENNGTYFSFLPHILKQQKRNRESALSAKKKLATTAKITLITANAAEV